VIVQIAEAHRLDPDQVDEVVQTTWLRFLQHADRQVEPDRIGGLWDAETRLRALTCYFPFAVTRR
jgi:hypothetical protein